MLDDDDDLGMEVDELQPEADTWLRDACYICHEIKRVKVTLTAHGDMACICASCLDTSPLSTESDDWQEIDF